MAQSSRTKERCTPALPRWKGMALMVSLGIVGCGEQLQSPTGVEADVPSVAAFSPGGGWITRVTGGGTGHLPTGQINTHVNVTHDADGTTSGTFANYGRIPQGQNEFDLTVEWDVRVDADCFEIEGNTVWMSGPLKKLRTFDVPPFPAPEIGDTFLLVVRDNEGEADEAWIGPNFLLGVNDCRDRPGLPPTPDDFVGNGEFTIHRK